MKFVENLRLASHPSAGEKPCEHRQITGDFLTAKCDSCGQIWHRNPDGTQVVPASPPATADDKHKRVAKRIAGNWTLTTQTYSRKWVADKIAEILAEEFTVPATAGGAREFYKQKYGYAPQRGETLSVEAAMQFADEHADQKVRESHKEISKDYAEDVEHLTDHIAQLRQDCKALEALAAERWKSIEQLRQERDTLKREHKALLDQRYGDITGFRFMGLTYGDLVKVVHSEKSEPEARERVESALRQYGSHLPNCKVMAPRPSGASIAQCNCGLDKALATLKSSQEEGKS